MNDYEYLYILLDGYANHREYLTKYFMRKAKEANSKYIEFDEFIRRMDKAIDTLKNELENEIQKKQAVVYRAINQAYMDQTADNKEETEKKIDEFKSLLTEKNTPYNPDNISLWLPTFTQNKFEGQLFLKDTIAMRVYLLEMGSKYLDEIIANQKPKPKPKDNDIEKTLRTDLNSLFDEANKLDVWKKIITELKRNEQIDPDSNKWLGNMDELAGTIRVIEFNHLKLKRKLSIKEIIKIAMTNFSFSLNDENVKGETVRKWNDRIRL